MGLAKGGENPPLQSFYNVQAFLSVWQLIFLYRALTLNYQQINKFSDNQIRAVKPLRVFCRL